MVWIVAALVVAVVLLVLFRLMGGGEDDAPQTAAASAGKSGAKPSAQLSPAAKAAEAATAKPGKSLPPKGGKDDDESEGTKVASVPPPPGGVRKGGIRDLAHESTGISAAEEVSIETTDGDDPTGPQALILVTATGRTDAGRKRKHNEDSYLTLPSHGVYVIADGMGGYAAGEVASQLAVEVIGEAFNTNTFGDEIDRSRPIRGDELCRAISMANTAILTQAQSNEAQHGMGTTVVSCRFSPNKQRAYIAHVGDSRCYRIRNKEIRQMTIDHTLGAAGITGPAAAKLSRAVGIGEIVEVDLAVDAPHVGDHYLLCSDGLSKMLPDEMIRDITIADIDLDRAVQKLIETANERGGRDNITVILIRVDAPEM